MSELATKTRENQSAADPQKRTVLDLIRAQEKAIQIALPRHMTEERFTRTVITEVRRNPALLKCDPMSLLASIMLSAQLGLELGPLGHAYLVPYKREVTFIIGYQGMVDLARRSGQVSSIQAFAVHEGDDFHYQLGLNPDIHHIPASGDSGELTHVYAVAKYKDGGFNFVVLTREDVEKYRARSAAGKNGSGPWGTDYEAMALKTAIRRLWRWLPRSPEMLRAATADETAPREITTDIADVLALDVPESDPQVEDEVEDAEVEPTWEQLISEMAVGDRWADLADLLGEVPEGTKSQLVDAAEHLDVLLDSLDLADRGFAATFGISMSQGKEDLEDAVEKAWVRARELYSEGEG